MFEMFDPLYWLLLGPAMLLSVAASLWTQGAFKRYSHVRAYSGLTGAEAAERMLQSQGVYNVKIERVEGFLSDHYDPSQRVLRLSSAVYDSDSIAAIGVACHEAGHALQHAAGYAPLALRTALVLPARIGSSLSYWILLAGIVMMGVAGHGGVGLMLVKVGIVCFAMAVLFSIVTLPVEWNASARAKAHIVAAGIVAPGQEQAAARVLNAAFMTYVAAAITALLQLLYWLLRSGLLGGRRDD
jgi:Zn-dependent membrane protease YugP